MNTYKPYPELDAAAAATAEALLASVESKRSFPGGTHGAELELALVDARDGHPIAEELRESIISEVEPRLVEVGADATQELGASAIEVRTPPLEVGPGFARRVLHVVQTCVGAIAVAAARYGAKPLGAGSIGAREVPTSDKEKYRVVPSFHDTHRRRDAILDLGGEHAAITGAREIGATNSIHVNIAASDEQEALRMHHAGLAYDGVFTAVGANAPLWHGCITGFEDCRLEAWERSHDSRTPLELLKGRRMRVGLPEGYPGSLREYVAGILDQPSVLDVPPEAAWAAKLGTCWPPSRVKFISEGHDVRVLLVEYRMLSAQPSAIETAACWLALSGFAEAARSELIDVPPISVARENAYRGRRGLGQKVLEVDPEGNRQEISGSTAAMRVLDLAEKGLWLREAYDNVADELLTVLRQRVISGKTPARVLVDAVRDYSGKMPRERAVAMAQLQLQAVAQDVTSVQREV